ncbi:4Fe-4S dicluster domain-containing protein [Desulfovibrio aerotolerans]|uniref:4Fe-4S dicluster domain-containing protein n=1 Tax=Solidesulfovibrio aerotolerans TaxID=295255 RepID=A0A7C9MDU9_9BACT|nr:NIL domain-containing protein [Solidesulfovibrio aerotolerans]MYL82130.1 4Fe-4S dicluster domain-containing protein [Solidesulfovibrio aerotolerans]
MDTPQDKQYRKVVYLTFPPEASGKPLVCDLSRVHGLAFSILQARITPRHEGQMTIEITGPRDAYERGIAYLKDHDIGVVPVAQRISRDDDSCIHCGMCTALCPTKALSLNIETRLVEFDDETCSACGMCTKVCPVKAMEMLLENGVM